MSDLDAAPAALGFLGFPRLALLALGQGLEVSRHLVFQVRLAGVAVMPVAFAALAREAFGAEGAGDLAGVDVDDAGRRFAAVGGGVGGDGAVGGVIFGHISSSS